MTFIFITRLTWQSTHVRDGDENGRHSEKCVGSVLLCPAVWPGQSQGNRHFLPLFPEGSSCSERVGCKDKTRRRSTLPCKFFTIVMPMLHDIVILRQVFNKTCYKSPQYKILTLFPDIFNDFHQRKVLEYLSVMLGKLCRRHSNFYKMALILSSSEPLQPEPLLA